MTVGADGSVRQVSLTYQQQDTGSPETPAVTDGSYTWTVSYSQLGSTPAMTPPATSTLTPPVIWSPNGFTAPAAGNDRRLMVARTAAHICVVGALMLLVLLAAGCGGGSKASAVASLKPTSTTTPSSKRSRLGRLEAAAARHSPSSSRAACARTVSRTSRPRRVDRSRNQQSPAFRPAMVTCTKLYPSSRSTGASLTEAQRAAALAQAKCIREHGVPNFPDPTFPSSGGELFPAIPGFHPASPVFKRAAAACGLRGSIGQPHGG